MQRTMTTRRGFGEGERQSDWWRVQQVVKSSQVAFLVSSWPWEIYYSMMHLDTDAL